MLPLALCACTATVHPATRFGAAEAVDARFVRVAPQSVAVQLSERAHATVLEVTPGGETVAEWLGDAAPRALRRGRHVVFQGDPPASAGDQAACDRPGERVVYDWTRASGPVSEMRRVESRGRSFYCVREPASSRASGDRHLLVLMAARPVDEAALERARTAFNQQYAGSPSDAPALAEALSRLVASQWPGSAAYYVEIPAKR
ncbi:MAG TPA: hypothetical protein VFY65_13650 [Longimicrobium sp.]|nr:hypothetical protein [Longimicrobium sp.]